MKHFLVWLTWKLFMRKRTFTCIYIGKSLGKRVMQKYGLFLEKNIIDLKCQVALTSYMTLSEAIKIRRELMYKFLVKGER